MVGWMPGFFDIEERLRELSAKGDDLECIKGLVDFGKFRADLEAAVPRADRSGGGRPPFDHVFYGWTDRQRHHCRRSQAAQHRGREEGDQGGAHTTGLEGQARETAPEGS